MVGSLSSVPSMGETDATNRRGYTQRGIPFVEPPSHELYGIVGVFEDLYGNRWDLIEPIAGQQ